MLYKEDWSDTLPRFNAWWQGEIVDRVALAIRCPRFHPLSAESEPPEPPDPFEFWTDIDYRIRKVEARCSQTAQMGEAFPFFSPDIGPGSMALYLGSEPTFDKRTVWYNPTLDSLAEPPHFVYAPDNPWWQANLRLVQASVERGRDRFLTTQPDIIENLDILASLRGTQALLFDLIEHPRSVHAALGQINDLYFRYFDQVHDLISPATPGGGCTTLFQVWAPGRMAKVQCDFSAMISPRMFGEFVVPYLAEQCRRLDFSVFHLDGPRCICHLDALLCIGDLDAIQWTPGDGAPGVGSPAWYDMYRKVRAARKSLLLLGMLPHEVEPLVRELGPEGLFISTSVETEEEGTAMLRAARQWTREFTI